MSCRWVKGIEGMKLMFFRRDDEFGAVMDNINLSRALLLTVSMRHLAFFKQRSPQ